MHLDPVQRWLKGTPKKPNDSTLISQHKTPTTSWDHACQLCSQWGSPAYRQLTNLEKTE